MSRAMECAAAKRAILAAAVCLLAGATGACWLAAGAQARSRPNIIVVQTDDQSADLITRSVMPNLVRFLRAPGTTFNDYVDSGPLCCPSRAVLLTGQYGHNNGVLWNNPTPYGDLREKDNTLPVWLRRAGYRTAHVGKYLNGYTTSVADPNEVAPGWDEWHSVVDHVSYYDYTLRANGRPVEYGHGDRAYLTRVLNDKAVAMIHRYVPRQRPLFMAIDHFAPHGSIDLSEPRCTRMAVPAPQDRNLFRSAPLPMSPSFNEADVSDKPAYVRAHRRMTSEGIQVQALKHGCRLASLREVDRGIARVARALGQEHELANTAILFTSDNGWLEGQHRIPDGKVDPYEESLHVPLVIRLPRYLRGPGGAPRHLSTTTANIDVAPTILKLAGARPCRQAGRCRTLDGRPLLTAIRTDGRRWPRRRGILLELEAPRQKAAAFTPCDYEGIRTRRQVYVEYHSATRRARGTCIPAEEVEHYDLRVDPFELDNIFPAPAGSDESTHEATLAARLDILRDCAGIAGRDARPASGHYCE